METVRLRTPFEVGEIPLDFYPRPQFARDGFLLLNGVWQYAILPKNKQFDGAFDGNITVPFSPESLLSGLPDGALVTPDDTLIYERTFTVSDDFLRAKTFLRFDAVDMRCDVMLNGVEVGVHTGGYTPFCLDVTSAIKTGENTLRVYVDDPTDTSYHSRGKQSLKHGGIWYTPQSGIWQTVWLESVPEAYLKDVTILPDIDNDSLKLKFVKSKPLPVDIQVLDGERVLANCVCNGDEIDIKLQNYALWSPESPKLYDLTFTFGEDKVSSYFGMRKFGFVKDSDGYMRLALNNKPYFMSGVLDQGYWSDGMLTPPSDEAMLYDIKTVKAMGFNMIRKHIKIEPLRWYYHCDKEGVLVWQDMVNGGTKYKLPYIGVLAFLGIHIKDDSPAAYARLARTNKEGRDEFEEEVKTTVAHLKNCVSLCTWVPFNEGWGQFDSVRITNMIKSLDPTRTVDNVSGWNDQGKGTSDMKSEHIYFRPVTVPKFDKRCKVLSEFGGYSYSVKDHLFSPSKSFGYRVFKRREKMQKAVFKLFEKRVIPNIKRGLSASVYTQLSDVEEEINGLVTYDRQEVKFDAEAFKKINKKLKIDG